MGTRNGIWLLRRASGGAPPIDRSRRWALAVIGVVATVTACAPTPAPPGQVANPSRTQVVDPSFGAGLEASPRDVLYRSGGSAGCGLGATDHESCGGSQTLDVYRRALGTSGGTIVYIHGGGFVGGDKHQTATLGPVMAQLHHGWDVVMVNYRLNRDGSAPWPAASDDVSAAIRWVRDSGPAIGLDTSKVVTFGHSAGGTLAALAGVAWNAGDPAYSSTRIDGWIDMAGINSFRSGRGRFWGLMWSSDVDVLAQRMSAVDMLDAADPPGHLIHGDADNVVDVSNSHEMSDAALRTGARVSYDLVDFWSDMTPMSRSVRNHGPQAGVNVAAIYDFLDSL